mmetsp:Transcript_42576/g.112353  ORF Transcript_42576/g.112353 Transcript_42576/m.112353 type:complete len:268 (+) Transcript_42576:1438-2241(+)
MLQHTSFGHVDFHERRSVIYGPVHIFHRLRRPSQEVIVLPHDHQREEHAGRRFFVTTGWWTGVSFARPGTKPRGFLSQMCQVRAEQLFYECRFTLLKIERPQHPEDGRDPLAQTRPQESIQPLQEALARNEVQKEPWNGIRFGMLLGKLTEELADGLFFLLSQRRQRFIGMQEFFALRVAYGDSSLRVHRMIWREPSPHRHAQRMHGIRKCPEGGWPRDRIRFLRKFQLGLAVLLSGCRQCRPEPVKLRLVGHVRHDVDMVFLIPLH